VTRDPGSRLFGMRAPGARTALVLPTLLLALGGLLAGLRAVPALRSQEAPPAAPAPKPGAAADTTAAAALPPAAGSGALAKLSYEREFFYYEGVGRRDPFQPLLDVDVGIAGPRFDELVLTGLFVGENGDGMVVVEDADRKGYFLKLGDVVGRATLVEIHQDLAVFDVRDFGITRRETLKLQRQEETS
jgi:hypothetical protein